MAKVVITVSLEEEINKIFKATAVTIFQRMKSLEDHPTSGKALAQIGGVVIKELKYESHRFYFITDGHTLKFGTEDELASLLIKFIRMSSKGDQQKVINEIRHVLTSLGFEGFR